MRTLITILILLLPLTFFGQQNKRSTNFKTETAIQDYPRVDSILTEFNYLDKGWTPIRKDYIKYNSQDLRDSIWVFSYDTINLNWVKDSLKVFKYDGNNQISQFISREYVNNTWRNVDSLSKEYLPAYNLKTLYTWDTELNIYAPAEQVKTFFTEADDKRIDYIIYSLYEQVYNDFRPVVKREFSYLGNEAYELGKFFDPTTESFTLVDSTSLIKSFSDLPLAGFDFLLDDDNKWEPQTREQFIYDTSDEPKIKQYLIYLWLDSYHALYTSTNYNYYGDSTVIDIGFQEDNRHTRITKYHLNSSGLRDVSQQKQSPYLIFPNPAHDSFYISKIAEGLGEMEVGIFDLKGNRIAHKNTNENKFKVEVNDFASGMYLLKISQGQKVSTHKVMIK